MALGGLTHWTVGLLATFMSVACVVAADTGAYAFGKTLGRTQLTAISPKKTVEGAFGGLLCSTALALGFWRVLAWPAHPALAVRAHLRIVKTLLHGPRMWWVWCRRIPQHCGLAARDQSVSKSRRRAMHVQMSTVEGLARLARWQRRLNPENGMHATGPCGRRCSHRSQPKHASTLKIKL